MVTPRTRIPHDMGNINDVRITLDLIADSAVKVCERAEAIRSTIDVLKSRLAELIRDIGIDLSLELNELDDSAVAMNDRIGPIETDVNTQETRVDEEDDRKNAIFGETGALSGSAATMFSLIGAFQGQLDSLSARAELLASVEYRDGLDVETVEGDSGFYPSVVVVATDGLEVAGGVLLVTAAILDQASNAVTDADAAYDEAVANQTEIADIVATIATNADSISDQQALLANYGGAVPTWSGGAAVASSRVGSTLTLTGSVAAGTAITIDGSAETGLLISLVLSGSGGVVITPAAVTTIGLDRDVMFSQFLLSNFYPRSLTYLFPTIFGTGNISSATYETNILRVWNDDIVQDLVNGLNHLYFLIVDIRYTMSVNGMLL